MTNEDVHGMNPVTDLWIHDFWGQNISLPDSHKSYRPVTVLTYRLNYAVHGIDSMGYHAGNVLLYALACVTMYYFCLQYLPLHAAKIASLLFCFHPVHVEAVASIVGRADCVCGLLFMGAIIFYSKSIRKSMLPYRIARNHDDYHQWNTEECYFLLVAYILAVLASLAKEIGVTVFGLFVVAEIAEIGLHNFSSGDEVNTKALDMFASELKIVPKRRFVPKLISWIQSLNRAIVRNDDALQRSSFASMGVISLLLNRMQVLLFRCVAATTSAAVEYYDGIGARCFQCSLLASVFLNKSRMRVLLTVFTLAVFSVVRLRINGPHSLYKWTVLENHIALLPTFLERSLSYAQCHFWYFAKLIFPRYLCFDYGYACIPTVHTIWDVRNVLPLSVYAFGAFLFVSAIQQLQWTILVAGAMLVIPLVPALNILFPVGTVLAERLLFIPSVGMCMMVAYFIAHPSMYRFWSRFDFRTNKATNELAGAVGDFNSKSPAITPSWKAASSGKKKKGTPTPVRSTIKVGTPVGSTPTRSLTEEFAKFSDSDKSEHEDNSSTTINWDSVNYNSVVYSGTGGLNNRDSEHISCNTENSCRSYDAKQAAVYPKIIRYLIVPVCALATVRILSRNVEWATEMSLFRSALDVCPLSVKALSNYASLTLNEDRSPNTLVASDLAAVLYDRHVAARINHAYARQQSDNSITSLNYFDEAVAINPDAGKAWGASGALMDSLQGRLQSADSNTRLLLQNAAKDYIEHAIRVGFYPPNLLHVRGSISLMQADYEEAIFYLQLALRENNSLKATAAVSGSVHLVDLVVESYTLNQIGSAYLVSALCDYDICFSILLEKIINCCL
jgi:tetratricopeptide (TPR) repeat protein